MANKCPRMVSIKEAAKESGLSYDCIRQMCIRNEIVFIRPASKYFINLDKLFDYMDGKDPFRSNQNNS